MINANSALFTELTSEEGATVSGGGLQLQVKSIQCIKAGADLVGNDDTILKVNGKEEWKGGMGAGSFKLFEPRLTKPVEVGNFVGLYDDDGWSSRDDFMGGFNITGAKGPTTVTLSGSGSTYQVTYRVIEVDDF